MSHPAEERSEDIVGYTNKDGSGRRDDHQKTRKAKRVSLFQFRRRRKKGVSNASSSNSAGCFGKRVGGNDDGGKGGGDGGDGGDGGCVYCLKRSPNRDSPVDPQTSDPNSPNFTFQLLRALVEKNDFYSKQCNHHFDVADPIQN